MADRYAENPFEVFASIRNRWTKPWVWGPILAAVALAVLADYDEPFYRRVVSPETGVLETAHVLSNVITAGLAAVLLTRRAVAGSAWMRVWVALILVGAIYVAGEEASWGQHYAGWATPDPWQAVNDQNETNIHNTSSWFDQKPRILLEIAVLFGALFLPLARATRLYPRDPKLAYLIPTIRCVPAAAMVLLARVDDWVADINAAPGLLFYRPAEVEELFLYTVVLIYTTDLVRRVRHSPPPA